MNLTIIRYDVIPGRELMFEAGVELARTAFLRADGYERLSLERSLDFPGRYWLLVYWRSAGHQARQTSEESGLRLELQDFLLDCLAGAPRFENCDSIIRGAAQDDGPADAARNEGLDIVRLVARPLKPFDTQRRPDFVSGTAAPKQAIPTGEKGEGKKDASAADHLNR